MARPRIGLALGSGSARGWSHIGVIEALLEAGIEPDIVCGTSMGALVGAAHAAGKLSELGEWAETVNWREVVRLLDPRLLRGGLIDGRQIVRFMHRFGISGPIEDLAIPFAAVATDLATGEEVVLTRGPLDDAVRASIALPGIFSPGVIDDRWLLDGGLVNPVPVSACRALGADVVIAVNLNGIHLRQRRSVATLAERTAASRKTRRDFLKRIEEQMPPAIRVQAALIAPRLLPTGTASPGYFDVLASSIYIMQDQITRVRLAAERPQVVLNPNLRNVGLLEFNRAKEAVAAGRACATDALPEIRKHL